MGSRAIPTRRRLAKLKGRCGAAGWLVGGVIAASAVLPAGAAAQVGTPKYPDVRALPPYDIRLGRETVGFERHYVIRFSTAMYNGGTGPVELHGTPATSLDLNFTASQWIYEDPAGLRFEPVGLFAFHAAHRHFHFDGYGRYELWSKRSFDRAQASDFTTGAPLHVSPKVSFCMIDSQRFDANAPPARVYQTCTPALQGVSPGWADIYDWGLPDQWIDVGSSPLPDGDYVVRNIADPFNVIYESPGKADPAKESHVANDGATAVKIVNGQLASS